MFARVDAARWDGWTYSGVPKRTAQYGAVRHAWGDANPWHNVRTLKEQSMHRC